MEMVVSRSLLANGVHRRKFKLTTEKEVQLASLFRNIFEVYN
ncbi:MAG: hypothetical protein K0Q87_4905 [Neobacillus sp.]|nr:hypothetical protein [Neobacillus sp.]